MHSDTIELSGSDAELPGAVRRAAELELTGWFYVGTERWTAYLFVERGRLRFAKFGSTEGSEALACLARVLPGTEFVFSPGRARPQVASLDISTRDLALSLSMRNGPMALGAPAHATEAASPPVLEPSAQYAPVPRGQPVTQRRRLPIAMLLVVAATAVAAFAVLMAASRGAPSDASARSTMTTVAQSTVALATPVPALAATAVASPVMVMNTGRVALRENFADNSAHWPSDPRGVAWLEPGAYNLASRQADRFVAIGVPGTSVFGDLTVRATFQKVDGPSGGGYGLILRDQGPGPRDGMNQTGRYYLFEVADSGTVSIRRREGTQWVDILPRVGSSAVATGNASNQMLVRASAKQFTLAVNGQDVATRSDDTLSFGSVGIFVGGDLNHVRVQDLTILVSGAE